MSGSMKQKGRRRQEREGERKDETYEGNRRKEI